MYNVLITCTVFANLILKGRPSCLGMGGEVPGESPDYVIRLGESLT